MMQAVVGETVRSSVQTTAIALIGLAVACGGSAPGSNATDPGLTTISGTSMSGGTAADSGTGDSGDGGGSASTEKLDINEPGPPEGGCDAIDFLFVVDNSASMATHQLALTEQFPSFITAMYAELPENIDVHVGLTTTDFDAGCAAAESTSMCQSNATLEEVEAHYRRPDQGSDMGNGTQGRLFQFADRYFFESNSDDDPAELSAWFTDAAVAAGEAGCSFEMPVAAAGFAAHPANLPTNNEFFRDAGALTVIFFLTDEPDKSPESKDVYVEMLADVKEECGGTDCIFVSGLLPTCVPDINQKLWQFMTLLSDDQDPPWGDIQLSSDYSTVFGDALADTIAEQCSMIAIP